MKNVIRIFVLFLLINYSAIAFSQIALSVSKNEVGSSVKYSLQVGKTMDDAYAKATSELESLGLKDIMVLKSTENTGHNLNAGYYVLIISSRKILGGKFFVSYGLGVSAVSHEEAIQRAIVHLKEYDWGYEKAYGYAVEKEGRIETFNKPEEKKN